MAIGTIHIDINLTKLWSSKLERMITLHDYIKETFDVEEKMPEILPCPFCGESSNIAYNGTAMYCNDCTGEGPGATTELEAIELWNKRS